MTLDDLGLFDIDIKKDKAIEVNKTEIHTERANSQEVPINKQSMVDEPTHTSVAVKVNQTMKKLDRVIDGASMLRVSRSGFIIVINRIREYQKQLKNVKLTSWSPSNLTEQLVDNSEDVGYNSAHASPCPSSELRCVDGRCITLAQLCDGTIDCSDHADEDNCYT
ncbi:unnamed protein product [Danaus chrysippus]|uniref:(African queen) hypothetical protein n=1 Tax=Danaus chrysippus TaxID=151541 RepID=A0A8J2WC06_9NEOP|nr:unnamed protein product [Danaus chrysippus]